VATGVCDGWRWKRGHRQPVVDGGRGWWPRMVAAMMLNDGGEGITAAQSTSLHCPSRVAVVARRKVAKGAAAWSIGSGLLIEPPIFDSSITNKRS
jgi:hypothetical protein